MQVEEPTEAHSPPTQAVSMPLRQALAAAHVTQCACEESGFVPAGQTVQAVAEPAGFIKPALQATGTTVLSRQLCPSGQSAHVVRCKEEAYLPAAHAVQEADAPMLEVPTGQVVRVLAVPSGHL